MWDKCCLPQAWTFAVLSEELWTWLDCWGVPQTCSWGYWTLEGVTGLEWVLWLPAEADPQSGLESAHLSWAFGHPLNVPAACIRGTFATGAAHLLSGEPDFLTEPSAPLCRVL